MSGRDERGRYTRGHVPDPRGGRPAGSRDKLTRDMKEAILGAAEQWGANGRGQDGLQGFYRHLLATMPDVFATHLLRLIPREVQADVAMTDATPAKIETVNVAVIPVGAFLLPSGELVTREQAEQWHREAGQAPNDLYERLGIAPPARTA